DHREVNRVFVDDLLAAVQRFGLTNQGSASGMPSSLSSIDPANSVLDILDLGTGTAQIPIELCSKPLQCRVMAVDAAVSMLDLARYNVEAASLSERIQLAQIDAKALP